MCFVVFTLLGACWLGRVRGGARDELGIKKLNKWKSNEKRNKSLAVLGVKMAS